MVIQWRSRDCKLKSQIISKFSKNIWNNGPESFSGITIFKNHLSGRGRDEGSPATQNRKGSERLNEPAGSVELHAIAGWCSNGSRVSTTIGWRQMKRRTKAGDSTYSPPMGTTEFFLESL